MKAYAVVLALLLVTVSAEGQTFAELATASTSGAFGAGAVLEYAVDVFQKFSEEHNRSLTGVVRYSVLALSADNLTLMINTTGTEVILEGGNETINEVATSAIYSYDFSSMTVRIRYVEPFGLEYSTVILLPVWIVLNPTTAEIYEGKLQGFRWRMINETALWATCLAGHNFTYSLILNEYNITEKAVIRSAPAGGLGTAACSNGSKTESYRLVEFIPAPRKETRRTFDPLLILVVLAVAAVVLVIVRKLF